MQCGKRIENLRKSRPRSALLWLRQRITSDRKGGERVEQLLIPAAVLLLGIICYQLLTYNRSKQKKLRAEWSSGEFIRQHESIQSISSYWKNKKAKAQFYKGVDQLTWDDLSMDRVFKKMNYTQSSVGSEYLFNLLREVDPYANRFEGRERLFHLFTADAKLRERVLLILESLGKRPYANSSSYFYEFNEQKIKYPLVYALCGCLPIVSVVLLLWSLPAGFICLTGAVLLNLAIYYRNKKKLNHDLESVTYIAAIVNTGKSLAAVRHERFEVFEKVLNKEGRGLRKISFFGKVLSLGSHTGGDFDIFFEYIRIVLLLDFISYNQIIRVISANRAAYQKLWEAVGELDAAIAVAYYRNSLPHYTTPEFHSLEQLAFKQMAHPLLDDPVTNSSTLEKSVLITGSNASGKSTYIKAVAINCILAQTIHTVLAESWTMKPGFVVTSMAIQDDVLNGDSYFVAEIKSLKRILRFVEDGQPVLSFVDEILKGTNTIERISASAAIMEWLSANQGLNIIASHDIELAEMAGEIYTNYHFREFIEHGKVMFDYKICHGPSKTRNAIKLLEVMNYPDSVTTRANQLAEHFTDQREWKELSGV